jgi:hypothetical protein
MIQSSAEFVLPDPRVGTRLFVDGVRRSIFQDRTGRQYLLEEGQRIDGVFLDPETAGLMYRLLAARRQTSSTT